MAGVVVTPRSQSARLVSLAVLALAVLAFAVLRHPQSPVSMPAPGSTAAQGTVETSAPRTRDAPGDAAIAEAFRRRESGVWVESSGVIERLLADDREGSPHQRFLMRLADGRTLLVAHNLDLAPRVPVHPGDRIRFRGEYAWNDRGGVIHWTHRDVRGGGPGGWIELRGRTYR